MPTIYLLVSQGHFGNVEGLKLSDVLATGYQHAAEFIRAYPGSARFYRPTWLVTEDTRALPVGYERYEVLADDTLGPRVANWDSGD